MLVRLHSLLGLLLAALLALHLYRLWPLLDDRELWVLRTVQHSVSRTLVVALILAPVALHLVLGLLRLREAAAPVTRDARGLALVQAGTGALLLGFLGYHLVQVWGHSLGPHASPRDGYAVLFRDLGRPVDFGIYLVGVSATCFHAAHGLARAAVTWGLARGPRSVILWRLLAGAAGFTLWALLLQLLGHFVLGQRLVP